MPDEPTAMSDGEGPSVQSLNEIFTDVTGVERFVETQEQLQTSTRLMADSDPGDYVATMVQDTGLSETLSEPKTEGSEE